MWKLKAFFAVAVVVVAGCTGAPSYTVTYKVDGFFSDQSAALTYTDGDGSIVQSSQEPLPFETTFRTSSCDPLSLSAQNQNRGGSVTVSILVNGATIKRATSSGAYVIASTSADPCR